MKHLDTIKIKDMEYKDPEMAHIVQFTRAEKLNLGERYLCLGYTGMGDVYVIVTDGGKVVSLPHYCFDLADDE